VGVFLRDARDASTLASGAGRAPLDISASAPRPSGDGGRGARAGCAVRARESSLGYRRIQGELVGLGIRIAASTVWAILRREGIEPAPRRLDSSWKEFLRRQAASIIECDFLTVDTVFFKRFYILFFIELASRRVHLAGVTATPITPGWPSRRAT
jgi:hypothetical protein